MSFSQQTIAQRASPQSTLTQSTDPQAATQLTHQTTEAQLGNSKSVSQPSKLLLSTTGLESIIGKNWTGIVYICDPYCNFVTLVQAGLYSPSPTGQKYQAQELKLIPFKDPLYPLLVQELPVRPHLALLLEMQASQKNNGESANTEQPIPPYAESSFDFGYSVEPGVGMMKGIAKNSDQVQSDWSYPGVPRIFGADLHLMKGKPVQIFKNYFQFVLSGGYWMTSKMITPETKAETSIGLIQYRAMTLAIFPKYKVGLSYFNQQRKYSTTNNSLTMYEMNSTQAGLGVHLILRSGWAVNFYYPMQKSLKESQGFRVMPFKQTAYNLNVRYCFRDIQSFDVAFKSCVFTDYYTNKEEASLSPEVSNGAQSVRAEQLYQLGIQLRFGDELWR